MRTAFKVPLQSEVEMYIKEKKDWPDSFVKHYAEKFWNHYQASGWKLSSGVSIKDWKACFNSQWQTPKFKEDIEMLNVTYKTKIIRPEPDKNPVKFIDEILSKYEKHPTIFPLAYFGQFYEYLRDQKLLRTYTKIEVDNLLTVYQGDKQACRCISVMQTFDQFVNKGIKFSDIIELRNNLK